VFGVQPHDPRTLGISAGLLLAVGIIAAVIPALRASRINPIDAIRAE
jgi:ABC-type antimicrobial peptide transport system permease subunit